MVNPKCASAQQHGYGVFGDIYVSSYTQGWRPDNPRGPYYPEGGFVISEAFRDQGGAESLFAMCGNCPANTTPHELAGCYGMLVLQPYSAELEARLRDIVSRLGLEQALAEAFPRTSLIWFGLWTASPVPEKSLEPLRLLLSELLAEDQRNQGALGNTTPDHLREFSMFVRAIELAQSHHLPLYVRFGPPGHTDLGFYTIFPHCPHCKAEAPVERWKGKYPTAPLTCEICGTVFSPAQTASSEPMDEDEPGLRDIMGEARFTAFAREYLLTLGHSPEDANAVIQATEAKERQRREERRQVEELWARKQRYLHEHIFVGLKTLPPPPSELDQRGLSLEQPPWLDAENLAEALRRARAIGIIVISLAHACPGDEVDRFEHCESMKTGFADPLFILARWVREGCTGTFTASFRVPDSLVETTPTPTP